MNEPTTPPQPERRARRPLAIAVVALIALIGGCASWRIPRYIDDKVDRAQICLRDAKVSYRHLTLTPGLTSIQVRGVTSEDDRGAIEKALNACSNLGTVSFGGGSGSGLLASQRFEWGTDQAESGEKTAEGETGTSDAAGITVSGTVRSEDDRGRILAAARLAADGAAVTDELKVSDVASNAPTLDRFVSHLPRLRKLVDPALVTIEGTAVNITGAIEETNTSDISDLLADMAADGILPVMNLSTAPSGAADGSTEAALAVTFQGDSASISGTVPSKADVLAIRSTIGQSYDTWDTSGLTVGSSETGSDSVKGLAAALGDVLSGLAAGRVTLEGETVTIEGEPGADALKALTTAVSTLEKNQLTASVRTGDAALDALGSGTQTTTGAPPTTTAPATTAPATTAPATTAPPTTAPATTAPPTTAAGATAPTTTAPLSGTNKAISDQLASLVASSPIPFETGSATLGAGANTVLDQIATLLNQATGVTIRIEGHTDSLGDATANQVLSESRANAVFEALAARGVARTAMTAAGLGSAQPIADNATAAGRATNRRVVFVLAQG